MDFYIICRQRDLLLKPVGSPRHSRALHSALQRSQYDQKFPPAGTGGQSNTAVRAFFSGQAWVASWGLLFLLPQSRLEKISPRLAGNHPYHTRKRQQYREFNERSNCCGSPTLCCGGVMNDNRNAPCCEEIVAAWLLFKLICYGCNFSSGVV